MIAKSESNIEQMEIPLELPRNKNLWQTLFEKLNLSLNLPFKGIYSYQTVSSFPLKLL